MLFEIWVGFAFILLLYAFSDDINDRLIKKKMKRKIKMHIKKKQKEKGSDVNGFNV